MTVKDFKKYLNTLDNDKELSFYVCFQDRTDSETTQDWYTLEFLKDSDSYFNKEKEVWRKYIAEIQEGISNHKNTIADATHLHWPSRSKLLNALHGLDKIDVNIYYFHPSLETCLQRNALREGRARVPADVLKNMYKSFTNPTFDPYNYHIIGEMVND